MANFSITVTIPNQNLAFVLAAAQRREPKEHGETDLQWAKRLTLEYFQQIYKEGQKLLKDDEAIASKTDSGMTVS